MRRETILLLATAILCAGCYHVTVITGAPAATATTVDKPWQNSFVYGLVPPGEITPANGCQQGVSKVETERSFLNGLVGAITWNIYTPMHVVLTCSSGR